MTDKDFPSSPPLRLLHFRRLFYSVYITAVAAAISHAGYFPVLGLRLVIIFIIIAMKV